MVRKIVEIAPEGLDKVFLVTTDAEATENAIKLAKTWGSHIAGPEKNIFVTFTRLLHNFGFCHLDRREKS